MNLAFSVILLVGLGALLFRAPGTILPTLLKGVEDSVSFSVKLFVIYAVFLGAMKVLEKSGATKALAKALTPLSKRLFPNETEPAYQALNLNLAANMLGMGGAATPMGLKSMQLLESKKNQTMLVVLNAGGIQLIPTTILAMRAEHLAATDIMLPYLIVTLTTTVLGVVLVKLFVK